MWIKLAWCVYPLAVVFVLVAIGMCYIRPRPQTKEVLKECPCTGNLTLHKLHGPWNGGEFECTVCHSRHPARVVNR